jgi:ankyrin repeat protein
VNDASEGGWSALHVAGMYDSAISAAAAIDGKADVFQRDVYGRTPLHMGAANNAVEALTHMVAEAKRGLLDQVCTLCGCCMLPHIEHQ